MSRVLGNIVPGSKIFLVGEAPGETEELTGMPFMGESGQELTKMMHQAGLVRQSCSLSNVFSWRPKNNKLEHFSLERKEWVQKCKEIPGPNGEPHYPGAGSKLYFDPAIYVPEIERLRAEILASNCTLIVALGNIALWALCREVGISKLRGTVLASTLVPGLKVLPTFHPASVIRSWYQRPVVITDLMKAKRESEFLEIRRPERELWLEPTVEDLLEFERRFFPPTTYLGADVETWKGQITCIGFAPSKDAAICIPLLDRRKEGGNYYSPEDELAVFKIARRWLEDPSIHKIFQNGLYDVQYFYRYGIRVRSFRADTMLAHFSLYSELEKSLGFLGSVYTDEAPWKLMRASHKDDFKKED